MDKVQKAHELTMLYLNHIDISGMSPTELVDEYSLRYNEISKRLSETTQSARLNTNPCVNGGF